MTVIAFPKKKDNAALKGNLMVIAIVVVVAASFLPNLLAPKVLNNRLRVKPTIAQLQTGDHIDINDGNPGQPIEIRRYCVRGKYTIFDFSSPFCGPCQQMAPALLELTKFRPDIAVRVVDVNRPGVMGIDWSSPVCRQYGLTSLPHFKVFGPDGTKLVEGSAARQQIGQLLHEELEH